MEAPAEPADGAEAGAAGTDLPPDFCALVLLQTQVAPILIYSWTSSHVKCCL